MSAQSSVARRVQSLQRWPDWLAKPLMTLAFTRMVPFAGTAGVRFEQWDGDGVCLTLANKRKVQNHIKSPHAAAMALLAESASGAAFAWHLPNDKLPLIKRMDIRYVRRATGGLKVRAWVTPEQQTQLQSEERGSIKVAIELTDSLGEVPIEAEMEWAWVTR
ncbi:DUF4442 domain-containing protein [Paraferrimonas sedimenticola]|uniref:DUF4442 domain-containing protein n=1 Tax=Paraferrimonas sedimenticola TaxID=375674 RepID=A0AA37RV19_9GAMM|nr:DUF4442 domain-containing protein [Paraferrimonas sedimenticola]GLP95746.1 hypothetical protein GCM10007895_10520 [Paraferrimonas sedimenticola]